MAQVIIEVEKRSDIGRTANHRLRAQGKFPAVVYAHGTESTPVYLATKEFTRIAKSVRSSQIFTLKSSVKELDGRSAVVKEVQQDHLKGLLLHVDFQAIRDDEEFTVHVPIKIVGEAPGVKVDGGILTVVARDLVVRCFPKLIPSEIEVDVSGLNLGDSIHAQQVKLADGVKLCGNPGETVVSVVSVRFVEEETTTAAAVPTEGAVVAADGAAAPAAGAAAPAADGADAAKAAPAGAKAAAGAKDAKKEGKKEPKK